MLTCSRIESAVEDGIPVVSTMRIVPVRMAAMAVLYLWTRPNPLAASLRGGTGICGPVA